MGPVCPLVPPHTTQNHLEQRARVFPPAGTGNIDLRRAAHPIFPQKSSELLLEWGSALHPRQLLPDIGNVVGPQQIRQPGIAPNRIRQVANLQVVWPSGKAQALGGMPVDQLVTVYENPEQSPNGLPFVLEPWSIPAATRPDGAEGSAP